MRLRSSKNKNRIKNKIKNKNIKIKNSFQFERQYFDSLYVKDETIDGDFNAKDHAYYLKSLFQMMGYHPSSIFDYGFGKGTLLREISKKLECTRIGGCDVSEYAYQRLRTKRWAKGWSLAQSPIHLLRPPKKPYHLGLCNSIFQYIKTPHLKKVTLILAQSCKYVYLHVPTREDYKILKSDLSFEDPYAFQRTNQFYMDLLKTHFTFVSWGLLESKKWMKHNNSLFQDSIYRF